MKSKTELTAASQEYAAAYEAHYSGNDFALALERYKKIMASHPTAPEADYARAQVQNIVHAVVPKQQLLDAVMDLALAHLGQSAPVDDPHATESNPVEDAIPLG